MTNPVVQLVFEDNQTQHGDMLFRLGDFEHRCDSYYLAIDPTIAKGDESPDKVRNVLAILLEQWLMCIETTIDGETVFLPYEFSDQSTCWLRCDFADGNVRLQPGWSDKEGWSLYPCLIMSHTRMLDDFEAIEEAPSVEVARALFELDVNSSLQAARAGISPDNSHLYLAAADAEEKPLSDLEIGQRAVVVRLHGNQKSVENFRENGLIDGTQLRILSFSADGSAVQIQIGDEEKIVSIETATAIDVRLMS